MSKFSTLAILLALSADAAAGELHGWQGMRVIAQEGQPARLVAADLAAEGRDQLIVVNTRQSRLDLYRWLPPDQRSTPEATDAERPNELPFAPDWRRTELALDEPPLDVVVADVDGDGRPELVVLTSPSNKIIAYGLESTDKLREVATWDLLPGSPAGRTLLLTRPLAEGKFELLVSLEQGVQALRLEAGARPTWLSPREGRGRIDWRLADVDGDGDADLVEWSNQARQSVRWHDCREGQLLPAQALFEQPVHGFDILALPGQPAELLLLGGSQDGLLRRYVLTNGEEEDLGRRESLPLAGGAGAIWRGLKLDGRPALVAIDPAQPRMRVQALGEQGWLAEQSFPSIGGVKAIAAPQAKAGTLLLWVKDAADLYVSAWESERLTFPASMPQSADVKDRRILSLESVGDITWWAQRAGEDVDLYVWRADQPEATQTRFPGLGAKVEKVAWLGGQDLLIYEAYAKTAKLVQLRDGKPVVSEPAHLAKADPAEFKLFKRGADLRPARMVDGVLQWLGDDLQAVDQVMLSEGQRMASLVMLPDATAWALAQGGEFLHHLQPDSAGILRETETTRLPGGIAVTMDPVLGLMLVEQDRVLRLSRGTPRELKLLDSLDSRVGRPSGVKEATIHRILSADVTADGVAEVILCDDTRHQLTVLERTPEGLKSLLSWPVFEDRTYPYGGVEGSMVAEPRALVGLDADGDKARDMAMLCHDRLIIYMARETR